MVMMLGPSKAVANDSAPAAPEAQKPGPAQPRRAAQNTRSAGSAQPAEILPEQI